MTRNIGILVTNTDESAFAARHPKDGAKFTNLMRTVRPTWQYGVFQVKNGQFPADPSTCDGYIITGSPASVHDGTQWIADLITFIQQLHSLKRPTVGCCFGHQAIAVAMGAEVGKNPSGWMFGTTQTQFLHHEAWMQPRHKSMNLFSANSEQVTNLAQGMVQLGQSEGCNISSFRVGEHFFTTQFHPEMTSAFMTALAEEYADELGQAIAGKAIQQAREKTDGDAFAEWMAQFLEKA